MSDDFHVWHTYDERDGTVCTRCGIMRRADGRNKPCPGRTPHIETRDDRELQRWLADGKAPAGSCPYCASRISMVERDGFFRARCSHRGCGATGPKMRSITRAADLFCCPPQRTAAGMAISARPTTGTVGELLAKACEGEIVEFVSPDGVHHQAVVAGGRLLSRRWQHALSHSPGDWTLHAFWLDGDYLRLPARLVPAAEADRDPNQRGPLPKGG